MIDYLVIEDLRRQTSGKQQICEYSVTKVMMELFYPKEEKFQRHSTLVD